MGVKRLYKTVSPYPGAALGRIDYAQNNDVLYMVHPDYQVQRLTRYGHTDWRYNEVTFGPTVATPVAPGVVAAQPNTTGAYATSNEYAITALTPTGKESRLSPSIAVNNDLTLQGNTITVNLPAYPAGVDRYVVYKKQGGAFGYIGYTTGPTFVDGSPPIQPVLSETAPVGDNPFNGPGNYPSSIAFHQQRMILANTLNIPNGVWGSRSSDFENMDKARPAKADDALAFAFNTGKVNEVQTMLSLDTLLVFTGDGVFSVSGGDGNVMTPGDINPKRQNNRGASKLKPLAIDTNAFFQPSQGSAIRSLGYTFEIEGYKSDEVSIFSSHLFDGYGIRSWDYQEEPYSCIWAARSDGVLLCFTWQLEQQVWGWTVCETDGFVEQVCVIPEDGYHRLYALIQRNIAGQERRFIERMALPHRDDIATACHLDCAITQIYDPPQGYIDQLWHLEGETVSVTYDGFVLHDQVVANGRVNLPVGTTASVITAGLRYRGRIETLPPALMTSAGSAHTARQQINEIVVRTLDTRGIEIGASNTELEQVEPKFGGDLGTLEDVSQVDYAVNASGDWKDESTVIIEQNEPLPAHIVGLFYDLKVTK